MSQQRILRIAAGVGLASAVVIVRMMRRHPYELRDKTVFITGGSRGLGLLIAREFALRGAQVAISGRDSQTLQRALTSLREVAPDALGIQADVTVREEVDQAMDQVRRSLGPVDVLVNNAGTICVGPLDAMTIEDFQNSINTHFWGPYFTTMAVLPEMKRRRQGRIVNISSIGGKISVPHLLPYSAGKFALTGFSKGLRAELLRDNIYVTTVCPGLMRTGSPRNAFFKGDNEAEYAWFSISDSLPIISMSAERAARQIVRACSLGKSEVVLSLPAKAAVKLNALFPNLGDDVLGVVNKFLPSGEGGTKKAKTGEQSRSRVSPSWLTALTERAAERTNQT